MFRVDFKIAVPDNRMDCSLRPFLMLKIFLKCSTHILTFKMSWGVVSETPEIHTQDFCYKDKITLSPRQKINFAASDARFVYQRLLSEIQHGCEKTCQAIFSDFVSLLCVCLRVRKVC